MHIGDLSSVKEGAMIFFFPPLLSTLKCASCIVLNDVCIIFILCYFFYIKEDMVCYMLERVIVWVLRRRGSSNIRFGAAKAGCRSPEPMD